MTAAFRSSEWRDLIRDMEDNGWTQIRHTKHQHLYSDRDGVVLGVPTSPSDYRSLANSRADFRRALRARTEQGVPMESTVVSIGATPPTLMNGASVPVVVKHDDGSEMAAKFEAGRKCKKCLQLRPLSEFRKTPRGDSFLKCKKCVAEATRETWRQKTARTPEASGTYLTPDLRIAVKPDEPKPQAASDLTPEAMATRLLVRRHQAEYDTLLTEMMTALGWDAR